MSLFEDTSSWEGNATKNWAISGGTSINLGAMFFGEAKIFNFHNLDVKKQKSFLLVSAGVGAKLEASFEAGSLLADLAEVGGNVNTANNLYGSNPLSLAPPETVDVKEPFRLLDLYMAVACGLSTGVDAGVVGTGVSGLAFRSITANKYLFSISGAKLEAILGVGINIYSIQGGVLFGATNASPTLSTSDQQKMDHMKRFGMRMHPGKM